MITKINQSLQNNVRFVGIVSILFFSALIFCYVAGFSLIIPLFLLFLGVHLSLIRPVTGKMFLHLGLLLALTVFTANAITNYTTLPYMYIPMAGFVMLAALLFNDLHITFLMALTSSFLVSVITKCDFGTLMMFFVGGLVGGYTVHDARTRGQMLRAGIFVSLAQILCLMLLRPDMHILKTRYCLLNEFYPLILNGFISCFIVGATLRIFESAFGVLTNFSLLELSDFNQPLLKRMILEAPGTYHHSLVVSNLAEAAADAIGANALLTRVGALYHDIGKIVKSEYFTENQIVGGNKHDDIEPSLSRLVVQNHVKEGVELAKKYHLNQTIADFIPQHHGTSLMHFFYQKAVEEAQEGEAVNEEDFRYPGPKPQTPETAITLLADSVEGATRSLDEPNPQKIEETVKKIINNKFIDGQLDESNLSLKQIEIISATFIRILSAMYHTRVKYPEKKNGSKDGNISRKSSDKAQAKPATDQTARKKNP